MNIPTANVFIAFDRETMENLFYTGATYKSLVKELNTSSVDGLLFDNVSNPNFISFEHSHGMGSGFRMRLSFIDPKREFEKRFIAVNPLEAFVGMSPSAVESTVSHVVASKQATKNSLNEYESDNVSKIKKKLIQAKGSRRLYIAYGTGNDLSLWSGPHVVTLANATVSVKGARQLNIELLPIPGMLDRKLRTGAYGERTDVNLEGYRMRHAGDSQELKFVSAVSYDPTEYLEGDQTKDSVKTFRKESEEFLSQVGFDKLAEKIKKFDFHAMVVDTIRSYVQKATNNKNVIVLLPDLNFTCRFAINDKGRETGAIDENGGEGDSGGKPGAHAKGETSTWENKSAADKGKDEAFVREVMSSFGMKLLQLPKTKTPEGEEKSSANGQLAYYQDIEKNENSAKAGETNYEDNFFFCNLEEINVNMPDHKKVLYKLFKRISKLSSESYKPSAYCFGLVETNSTILKLWGNQDKWAKHWPCAGYDDLYDDGPTVIVGDVALIREYLFGGVDLQEKTESVNKLKEEANKVKKEEEQAKQNKEKTKEKEEKGPSSKDLYAAAALQIPLHPLDKVLLTNKNYNKEIREIVTKNQKGAFGDISYIPDTFSYRDVEFDKEEKDFIIQEAIPVFRYNTKNPNVLDMNFKYGTIYLQALNTGFLKEVTRLSSPGEGGALPEGVGSFRVRSRPESIGLHINKQISQVLGTPKKQEKLALLASKLSLDLTVANFTSTPSEAADNMVALLELLLESNLQGNMIVEQEAPGTPFSIMTDMAEDLYRKATRMDIHTLPMFHISELHNGIHNPCLLFAQDQDISQSVKPKGTALSQFYSGLYKIIGYSHRITSSDVSSKFALVKTPTRLEIDDE